MTAPEKKPEAEAPKLPEPTLTDHYMTMVKTALEFNASIIAMATQVIAMDASGHNRKTYKTVTSQINDAFRKYEGHIQETNRRIVQQFFPQEARSEDDGAES